jgi:hypothetical protein
MTDIPSLAWLPDFADSINRATLGSLASWEVRDETDPLRKVLVLRYDRWLRKEEIPLLRELLRGWADINDCSYRRSDWERNEFAALIFLRGLGPEMKNSPFEELKYVRRKRPKDWK